MFDVMTHNKEGAAKENKFAYWCRRVHSHRVHTSTATEHGPQSPEYKSLALDILTNELTPEQARMPRYRIRKDSVTTEQRSTIGATLRNHLGHAKVIDHIWNDGLPTLLDYLGR